MAGLFAKLGDSPVRFDSRLSAGAHTLFKELQADALRKESMHDFGHDILPSLLGRAAIYA